VHEPTAAAFAVRVFRDGENAIVSLVGELDIASIGRLRPILMDAASTPSTSTVVLDLADLTFLDSTALGLIESTNRALRARGGTVCIRNASASARRVFAVARLDPTVEILGTPREPEPAR
jgi:anti-sigma B factor antagonist